MGHAEFHSIPRLVAKKGGKADGKTIYRAVADGTDIVLVQISPMGKGKTEADPIRITPGDTFTMEGMQEIDVHADATSAPPIGGKVPEDAPPMGGRTDE